MKVKSRFTYKKSIFCVFFGSILGWSSISTSVETLEYAEDIKIYNGQGADSNPVLEHALSLLMRVAVQGSPIHAVTASSVNRAFFNLPMVPNRVTSLEANGYFFTCSDERLPRLLTEMFKDWRSLSFNKIEEAVRNHIEARERVTEYLQACAINFDTDGHCYVNVTWRWYNDYADYLVSINSQTCPTLGRFSGQTYQMSVKKTSPYTVEFSTPTATTR